VGKNVVVVGGGIAGLAAAIYLARGGCTVTLFEKSRHLGGRAVTHLRHGYRFNLGPHAFYRTGQGAQVLRELGIPIRGGSPRGSGVAMEGDHRHRFPGNFFSLLATGLLPLRSKLEAAKLMFSLRRTKRFPDPAMPFGAWLDANVASPDVRRLLVAVTRLASYCPSPEEMSAAAALQQLKIVLRGVLYIDEGWQKIVDGLHSAAVSSGVNFVTSSRVVAVEHDGRRVRALKLGGLEIEADNRDTLSVAVPRPFEAEEGTRIPAAQILLAVDPFSARAMLNDAAFVPDDLTPVVLSTLDVALSTLPNPKKTFAVGIDKPLYFSVHSQWAQLTPKGGALIHVARYGGGRNAAELETLLDEMQPGWRDVLVHRRFLPSMIVSNATPTASLTRPPARTPIEGLYLAGDWVGDEGLLSDAALASARAASKAILSTAS
jgi:phytoene dehydrogenase-like protein